MFLCDGSEQFEGRNSAGFHATQRGAESKRVAEFFSASFDVKLRRISFSALSDSGERNVPNGGEQQDSDRGPPATSTTRRNDRNVFGLSARRLAGGTFRKASV
jgi:hypothetical protein